MPTITYTNAFEVRYDTAAPAAVSTAGSVSVRTQAGSIGIYVNIDGTGTGWRQFIGAGGVSTFDDDAAWTLNAASGSALRIGSAVSQDMLDFDTTAGSEVVIVGGADGLRLNDGADLRFGTSGTDLLAFPDGANVVWSGGGLSLWHDTVFTFADPTDTTKRARVDVGAVTAGQTRVLTVPDYNLTLAAGPQDNTIADPGDGVAIPVTDSGELQLTIAAGAETNTLADPTFVGQTHAYAVASVGGGTRAITAASAINAAANTVMTFNATTDTLILTAMTVAGALAWRVTHNDGVALA